MGSLLLLAGLRGGGVSVFRGAREGGFLFSFSLGALSLVAPLLLRGKKTEKPTSSQEPELLPVLLRQADEALHLLRVDADRLAKLLDDWCVF